MNGISIGPTEQAHIPAGRQHADEPDQGEPEFRHLGIFSRSEHDLLTRLDAARFSINCILSAMHHDIVAAHQRLRADKLEDLGQLMALIERLLTVERLGRVLSVGPENTDTGLLTSA